MHVIYCRLIGILHENEQRDQRGVFTMHHLRCSSRGDLERIAAFRVQVTSFRVSRRRDISADQGSLETFRFAIYQPRCIFLRVLIETCLTVSRSPWHRPAAPPLSQMYLSGCYLTSPFFHLSPQNRYQIFHPQRGGQKMSTFGYLLQSPFLSLSFFLSFSFCSILTLGQMSLTIVLCGTAWSSWKKKMAGLGSEVFTSSREIEFTRDACFRLCGLWPLEFHVRGWCFQLKRKE